MKRLITFLVFFFVLGNCYSQNFGMNNCTQDIPINFLNQKDAKSYFKNHIGDNNYISIIIDNNNYVDFNGKIYSLGEDLLKAIENTNLPENVSIYIGVEKSAHFDRLMQIICDLKNLNSTSISELRIYYFD